MYSITTIIYGTYIDENVAKAIEDLDEDPSNIFETLYHGSCNTPVGFCGVELDKFDECQYAIKTSSLNFTPTSKQKQEAKKMFDNLPDEIRAVAPPIDVYLVFSTS